MERLQRVVERCVCEKLPLAEIVKAEADLKAAKLAFDKVIVEESPEQREIWTLLELTRKSGVTAK